VPDTDQDIVAKAMAAAVKSYSERDDDTRAIQAVMTTVGSWGLDRSTGFVNRHKRSLRSMGDTFRAMLKSEREVGHIQ
jgi:hypothetical protein